MTRNWQDVKAEKVEHDALASRVAEVLGEHEWRPSVRHSAHNRHHFDGSCALCSTDGTDRIATVLADLVVSERAAAAVEALESAADVIHDAALYVMASDADSAAGATLTAAILDRAESIVRTEAAAYRSTNTTPTKETKR